MKNFLQAYISAAVSSPAEAMRWLEASYIQLSVNGLSLKPNPFYANPGNFKIYMPEQALVTLLQDEAAIGAYVAPDRPEQTIITNPADGEVYLLWTTVHFGPANKLILAANHVTKAGHPLYFETTLHHFA